MREAIAFKVLLAGELAWLEKTGSLAGSADDLADGFIHLSTAAQLDRTVNKHFANIDDVCIAAINLEALGHCVKWEMSGGGQLYPHLYGPLTLDVVIARAPLERNSDGTVRLPVAM